MNKRYPAEPMGLAFSWQTEQLKRANDFRVKCFHLSGEECTVEKKSSHYAEQGVEKSHTEARARYALQRDATCEPLPSPRFHHCLKRIQDLDSSVGWTADEIRVHMICFCKCPHRHILCWDLLSTKIFLNLSISSVKIKHHTDHVSTLISHFQP